MNHTLHCFRTIFGVALFALIQSSCLKQSCEKLVPAKLYRPVYLPLAEIRSAVKETGPQPISQNGKIYLYGNYIFINEVGKGIHVIDNADPKNPNVVSFINVPGNTDLAIKNNTLYADSYIDLVAIDITNPRQAREVHRVNNAFPRVVYTFNFAQSDSLGVITGFTEKDTVYHYNCNSSNPQILDRYFDSYSNSLSIANSSSQQAPQAIGKAGSMATFGLLNNHLYSIAGFTATTFNVTQSARPQREKKLDLRAFAETIFPYKHYLYMGGPTGMAIYDAINTDTLLFKGIYQHIKGCDPVIVENDLAYVTLRSGAICNTNTENVLDVLDVADPTNPKLMKSYGMSGPYGLGLATDKKLVVCEGVNGMRLLDAKDPLNISTIQLVTSVAPTDVIHEGNDIVLLVGNDGLYQFDIKDMRHPNLLSKINFSPKSL
ncbi:hypothetical protein J2T02_002331 [Chitinophaga terrae (ex Kim and Jung 2007)]|uniref:LVIVD repeat-containing protein n=1 Tax=Chitinophaga terrae (ex Kim and Jung 2007) TaxID=408074 RepID=UPI0027818135|nr:hypothetical protein [Chitinophaga terrae (ex Kim and Jung 2007)]MDQ0107214.1 hypothetical protein [Chitinophaga terrae (ex Kim and Jung 2007)]